MQHIIWIISTILIIGVSGLVFKELYSEKKKSPNSNILRPQKICFIVGAVVTVVVLSGVILCWFLDTSSSILEKYICAALIILFTTSLGGYLMLFYLNYKIIVYEDYFIYQNFWRIKKTIYYKDIVIDRTKLYPQVRQKQNNGKTRLVFKLGGILVNEDAFMVAYRNWKSKQKSKKTENT